MSGSNRRFSRSDDEDSDELGRARSFESLLLRPEQSIGWLQEGALQLPALHRVKYGRPDGRLCRSTENLHFVPGAESTVRRARRVRIRDGDEHTPGGRSGLNRSYTTRSLDDLDKSSTVPDSEFMGPLGYEKIHSALSSMEDLAHENGFEEKSSVNQFPINTESDFGDEEEDPSQQRKKYAFGPIELVVGHNVSTCKCVPKATCFHRNSWRGLITKDWSMKLFQGESRETEINFLPSSNPLSENAMERVKKMVPGKTVFTEPH